MLGLGGFGNGQNKVVSKETTIAHQFGWPTTLVLEIKFGLPIDDILSFIDTILVSVWWICIHYILNDTCINIFMIFLTTYHLCLIMIANSPYWFSVCWICTKCLKNQKICAMVVCWIVVPIWPDKTWQCWHHSQSSKSRFKRQDDYWYSSWFQWNYSHLA